MTKTLVILVTPIFIQMVFSQSSNINFNPSTTNAGPTKGNVGEPTNSNPTLGPVNSSPLSSPVGSNKKGSFAGAVGSSLSNLSKGPINSNPTLGPINSSPLLGPLGSSLSNKVGFIGSSGPNFVGPNFAGPIGQNLKGIQGPGGPLGTLGTSSFGFGPANFGPSQYGPSPYSPAAPFASTGNGNVAINGELPVSGNTGVFGQVPVTGNVQFSGKVPASGAVTITGVCSYGAPGFYGF